MRLIILLSIFACCQAVLSPDWISFKRKHGKSYKSRIEEVYRRSVYLDNKRAIDEHNREYAAGGVSFSMEMNRFGDLTNEEVNDLMNKYQEYEDHNDDVLGAEYVAPTGAEVPESVDWRTKGAVTPVKDQGSCGSCWAFSTTGSLEGQHFLMTGKLVSLSEQNLIDCSRTYRNHGCHGGSYERAFNYIKDNGGIDLENSYPYKGKSNYCSYRTSMVGAEVKGHVKTPMNDEEALKVAVATVGPISVAIDASRRSFHHYRKGIYYDKNCSSVKHNHAMLVVGYGTENGKDYWLVKNSWSDYWGEDGYIRMSRNRNNNCGIAIKPVYPIL